MTASVYQFPSSLRRNPPPADATCAALVFPAPRVEDEGGEPFTPNGTELSVAYEYDQGWLTLQQFVRIVEGCGDGDDQRAAKVLAAYARGARCS